MGCEADEVSYFEESWRKCAQEAGHSLRILSFEAPPALRTNTVLSGSPALYGLSCREALEKGGVGPLSRETQAWYTYQWCNPCELSHLDVFCESQLEAVLHTVQKQLHPWLTCDVPPLLVLAGSSQGGTVALALALDLMAKGHHRSSLVLLYHSTIMEKHLQKALPMSRLHVHLQLATSDTIYSPEAVESQAQRLRQAGHLVSVARDTQDTWHGGEVELEPSLDILRSFLMKQSDEASARAV
jgi:hypothetical protein